MKIMDSPTLQLGPHELCFAAPGTPATSPAERIKMKVDGTMRAFLARIEFHSLNR